MGACSCPRAAGASCTAGPRAHLCHRLGLVGPLHRHVQALQLLPRGVQVPQQRPLPAPAGVPAGEAPWAALLCILMYGAAPRRTRLRRLYEALMCDHQAGTYTKYSSLFVLHFDHGFHS
jgi:hypothetical protein